MRLVNKAILCIIFSFLFILQVGCSGNNFEAVAPPLNDFPMPTGDYPEVTLVIRGDFIEKKTLRVDKNSNTEFIPSVSQEIKNFSVDEKGILEYNFRDKKYKVNAKIVNNSDTGGFMIISEESLKDIPNGLSGEFSVITNEEKDCILVDKKAILLLDDNSAMILKVDEKGVLFEKEIKVDRANDQYYKVLGGLEEGEKVVLRK